MEMTWKKYFLVFLFKNSVRIHVKKQTRKEKSFAKSNKCLNNYVIRNYHIFYFIFKTHWRHLAYT